MDLNFHKVETLPATGNEGDIYFVKDTQNIYVVEGGVFVEYGPTS